VRGILGGTFDPPHLAHLAAAEAAYRQLGLGEVTFLPAGTPWQKAGESISAGEHRMAMTELAVAGVDYFGVDDQELRREGFTYTIDTLETVPPGEELTLILGADAAKGLATWHRYEEVLERCLVAVAPRLGVERTEVEDLVPVEVVWLDLPPLAVSGTDIRLRVATGRPFRFLVPDGVWRYVSSHDLYRERGRDE